MGSDLKGSSLNPFVVLSMSFLWGRGEENHKNRVPSGIDLTGTYSHTNLELYLQPACSVCMLMAVVIINQYF
jgi:hypothetical protein